MAKARLQSVDFYRGLALVAMAASPAVLLAFMRPIISLGSNKSYLNPETGKS